MTAKKQRAFTGPLFFCVLLSLLRAGDVRAAGGGGVEIVFAGVVEIFVIHMAQKAV